MPNWKRVITSGSDASLNTLTVSNGITGSLLGSASYADTSSYSTTLGASLNNNSAGTLRLMNSAGSSISTINLIASQSITSQTSSYSTTLGASLDSAAVGQLKLLNSDGAAISTFNAVTATTASHALTAQTLLGSVTSASYAVTASFAPTAGNISAATNLFNYYNFT